MVKEDGIMNAPTPMQLTSGQVRRGLGLSERQLVYLLGRHPEIDPPVVMCRRVWAPEHVEALRQVVEETQARAEAKAEARRAK
jgi:hypothetical protein